MARLSEYEEGWNAGYEFGVTDSSTVRSEFIAYVIAHVEEEDAEVVSALLQEVALSLDKAEAEQVVLKVQQVNGL